MRGEFVFQDAALDGMMSGFAHKAQGYEGSPVASDGESDRVARTLLRQTRAARGVSEIAAVGQFRIAELGGFMARSGTMASPPRTQWQARRMEPETLLHFLGRNEKWTSHSESPESDVGHCTHDRQESPLERET